MNQPNSPLQTSGYFSSSLSEVDSLSDSDWLDISSGRDSDLESVSDRGPPSSSPPSRRSSFSLGSSRDGEIDAWEGLVEGASVDGISAAEQPKSVSACVTDTTNFAVESDAYVDHDPQEDRVKEALDQSLIGTLSASRSSAHSASPQSSLRDLRLSFPDPLTSSRDELKTSYDTVKGEGVVEPPVEPPALPSSSVEHEESAATLTQTTSDSDLIATAGIPHYPAAADLDDYSVEFIITLYGQSPSNKWEFAQELVGKAIAPSGQIVTHTSQASDSPNRYVHFERQIGQNASSTDVALIRDKTEQSVIQSDIPPIIGDYCRPSLALVYLPSNVPSLPPHTFYLPVLAPTPPGTSIEEWRSIAEAEWTTLSNLPGKTLYLKRGAESPVIESTDEIDIGRARRAFRIISHGGRPRGTPKSLSEQISGVNAVTVIAVTVSLIMGIAANVTFRSASMTPTPTVHHQSTPILLPSANQTIIHSTPVNNDHMALITSSLKDFAVSVFNPAAPPSVVTTPVSALSTLSVFKTGKVESTMPPAATASPVTCKDCQVSVREPLGVMVRPTPTNSLSVIQMESPLMVSRNKRVSLPVNILNAPAKEITSLGAKIADTIQETVDVQVKAIVKSVQEDSQDLIEALDDLMLTIRRQSKVIVEQSRDRAQILRERLQYRNDRARGRAKELRSKGEKFVAKAAEELKDTLRARTEKAKNRARQLSELTLASDAWYWKVQGEWMQVLHERMAKDPEELRRGKRPRDDKANPPNASPCGWEVEKPFTIHCPFGMCEFVI